MERGQMVVIAVVFAALALFGLKVWSDRANEDTLTSDGHTVGDQARLGGRDGNVEEFGDSAGGAARPGRSGVGRLGDRNPLRPDGSRGGSSGIGDERGGESGRAGVASSGRLGGLPRAGGAVGGGSGGGIAGSGGVITGEGGALGHDAKARKNNLVDFLSSQPATHQEELRPEAEDGVTLKLEKTDDITKQGGLDHDVADSQDGEGIDVGENGKMQFPNNVNPDAAKFDITIKPNWSGSDQTDNALIELRGEHEWSNRVELVKNGEFLRFIVTDNTGVESDISYRINDWQAGDEHNIQAQYGPCENSAGNCTLMYVDGRKVGEKQYNGSLQFAPNTPFFVGGDHNTGAYGGLGGVLKSFKVTSPSS